MTAKTTAATTRSALTRRRSVIALAVLVVLALVFFLGGGWYFAGKIESDGLRYDHSPDDFNLRVESVSAGQVTVTGLSENEKLALPGTWGLESADAHGQLGEISASGGDEVSRRLEPFAGSFSAGDPVRLSSYAFVGDPQQAHGFAFDNVMVRGPLGDLPAWFIPGDSSTWAIFVHGRTATRAEALRMLPAAVSEDLPSLIISFRGDEGVEPDPSGYYGYGLTEWPDLEAAVRHAIENGASEVVLIGYSMGGGIIVSFMTRSSLADRVAGIVLDAPMLDFGRTVDHNAASEDLPIVGWPVPGALADIAKWLASVRYDVDWAATDYTDEASALDVPVLLFHGDDDPTVPVSLSRELATARPDIVTYLECKDAPHVNCWNVDRAAYESSAAEFFVQFAD